jgi:hypothetical protein
VTRFRPALAGDVGAIVAMMRGYYGQNSYTFVEAEVRAAAKMRSSSTSAAASRTTAAT